MTEVYPNNNDLLNILSDVETGVEYIPTGTAPYYLHFRKLLYRLLLACTRGNDLRVFDEGGLEIGVKAGKYWIGDNLIVYPGSSGDVIADEKENVYIYLDSTGNLILDEYSGWPDMGDLRHVRLAIASTSGGDIVSIADARDHHSIYMPASGSSGQVLLVEAHAADDTLTQGDSGSVHTNSGATDAIRLTLPEDAVAGTYFTFAVQETQQLLIDPGLAAIRDESGQTAGKFKWANGIGESIVLVADANGDWVTISKNGVWLQEA